MRNALRTSHLLACLLALLGATPALAEAPTTMGAPTETAQSAETTEVVLPASKCPALFGDDAARAANAALREHSVLGLARNEGIVEVVHGVAGWNTPTTRAVPGLTVLAAEPSGERLTARVRVDERWSAWCAPGVYRVDADAALGAGNQILAVLDEGLLASLDGDLVLVPTPKGIEQPATFRLIWRSGFALAVDGGGGSGGGGGGASTTRTSRASSARERSALKRASPRTLAQPKRSIRR